MATGALLESRPRGLYGWLLLLMAVQLSIGEAVRRRCYRGSLPLWHRGGWFWALLALLGIQAIQWLLVVPTLPPRDRLPLLLVEAFKFFVLVGYTEELWFRGIWFAIFDGRFLPSVLVGSLLFGAYHVPHGGQSAILATFVGGVFAVARYRGASVLSLALAHGLMDTLNLQIFPGSRFRVEPTQLCFLMALLCLTLSGGMLLGVQRIRPGRHSRGS